MSEPMPTWFIVDVLEDLYDEPARNIPDLDSKISAFRSIARANPELSEWDLIGLIATLVNRGQL